MDEIKHTPTPWEFTDNPNDSCCWSHHIQTVDTGIADVRSEEDASFIVKAVNSHEALLEAAKAAVFSIRMDGPKQPAWIQLMDDIERVISMAEGK